MMFKFFKDHLGDVSQAAKKLASTTASNLNFLLKYAIKNPKVTTCLAFCYVVNHYAEACSMVECFYGFLDGSNTTGISYLNVPHEIINVREACVPGRLISYGLDLEKFSLSKLTSFVGSVREVDESYCIIPRPYDYYNIR